MIRELKKYRPEEANRLLADVAQMLLPHPRGVAGAEVGDAHRRVLSLLAEKAGVQVGDTSQDATTRIFRELNREMAEAVLGPESRKAARERVGASGDLRPDLYEVKFRPEFALEETRGIRRRYVEDAIRAPSAIQHLPSAMIDDPVGTTLVLQHVSHTSAGDSILLVHALREGARLTIMKAWRVYLDDLASAAFSSPLELFFHFVNRYGVSFTLGPIGPTKMVLNQVVETPGSSRSPAILPIDDAPRGVEGISVVRSSRIVGVLYAVAVYSINCLKYFNDLKRHNDPISERYLEIEYRARTSLGG